MSGAPDRALPHDADIERAVLAALLGRAPWPADLDAGDFYDARHVAIFAELRRMRADGIEPDLTLLRRHLDDAGQLDAAGGPAYLAGLLDGTPKPTDAGLRAWCSKLRELAHTRAGIVHALDVAERLQAGHDAAPAFERLRAAFLCADPKSGVSAETKPALLWRTAADLVAEAPAPDWLLPGYFARGAITDISGDPKRSGKTTLLAHAVSAMLEGRSFLGRRTTRTAAVCWLTEEHPGTFSQAMQRAGLADEARVSILSRHDCGSLDWPGIVDEAVTRAKTVDAGMLIVDTAPAFMSLAGDAENDSGRVLGAMRPLQAARAEDLAVVSVRHDRKSGGDVGLSGRGSSAWTGAVDIVLQLRRPQGNAPEGMRELHALSRYDETPARLAIGLTPSGYVAYGDRVAAARHTAREAIMAVAPTSEGDALRVDALVTAAAVSRSTGQAAIDDLMGAGLLARIGAGKRGDPHRFFLPRTHSLGSAERIRPASEVRL